MSGQPMEVLTGGAGMYTTPPIAAQNANGAFASASVGLQPHYGPIALVLIAILVLFLLDRAGFRFAVTAGRR